MVHSAHSQPASITVRVWCLEHVVACARNVNVVTCLFTLLPIQVKRPTPRNTCVANCGQTAAFSDMHNCIGGGTIEALMRVPAHFFGSWVTLWSVPPHFLSHDYATNWQLTNVTHRRRRIGYKVSMHTTNIFLEAKLQFWCSHEILKTQKQT